MLGIFSAKFESSVYGGIFEFRGSVTHTLIGRSSCSQEL